MQRGHDDESVGVAPGIDLALEGAEELEKEDVED